MTEQPPTPEAYPGAPPPPPTDYAVPSLAQPDYPARLDVEHQDSYTRLLPLVKWLLAIPHWIVLTVLAVVAIVVAVIAWIATVITGRYPRGLFNFLVGVGRWNANVTSYLYLMTDRYPPFSLAQVDGHPVQFEIDYPEDGRIARWRPILHWLLAIPAAIVLYVISIVAFLVLIIAFFAILFTKRFPRGLFDVALVYLRWNTRVTAYILWMTPKYPPFTWS